MLVMKFGGTSVGNAKSISQAAAIVKSRLKNKPIVVVSAVAKMTDCLIALCHESLKGSRGSLDTLKMTHEAIIADLGLDRGLLAPELNELDSLVRATRKKKEIDKKTLDQFQSFGERMSAKIVAAHLNSVGIPSKAYPAW